MSGESLYNVTLSGFIVDGFAKSLVILELSELLKVSAAEAESFLKGNKRVIKTRVNSETAKHYQKLFSSKGIGVLVERAVDTPEPNSLLQPKLASQTFESDESININQTYLKSGISTSVQFNGVKINGNHLNGKSLNGTQVNGNHVNGSHVNGKHVNGSFVNGHHHINGNHVTDKILKTGQLNGWPKSNKQQEQVTSVKKQSTVSVTENRGAADKSAGGVAQIAVAPQASDAQVKQVQGGAAAGSKTRLKAIAKNTLKRALPQTNIRKPGAAASIAAAAKNAPENPRRASVHPGPAKPTPAAVKPGLASRKNAGTKPNPTGSAAAGVGSPKVSMANAFSDDLGNHAAPHQNGLGLIACAIGVGIVALVYVAVLINIFLFVINRLYSIFVGVLDSGFISVLAFNLIPATLATAFFLFLLRPIFPKNTLSQNWFPLDPTKEKTFIRFIQHISQLVGATVPTAVNINNDVAVRVDIEGGARGLKEGKLVCWIGMPLVISLSAKQLAGLIAREFSRYKKGRLGITDYLIREINTRLYNSVHNLDGWKNWLEGYIDEKNSGVWELLGKVILFIGRLVGFVLQAFLLGVNAMSSRYLRKSEINADFYQVLFAGTENFLETFRLKYSTEFVIEDNRINVFNGNSGNRLVNDFPALIYHDVKALDADIVSHLEDEMIQSSTQWYDTRPSIRDRIINAEELDLPGITQLDVPTYRLLRELKKICYRATIGYYRDQNITFDPKKLLDIKAVAISSNEEKQRNELCRQYFNEWFTTETFWKVDKFIYAKSLQLHKRKRELNELIVLIRRNTPDFSQLKQALPPLFNRAARLKLAAEIQRAGYALDKETFALESVQPAKVQGMYKDALSEYSDAKNYQDGLCETMGLRICLAGALLNEESDRKRFQYLVNALDSIYSYAQKFNEYKMYVSLVPSLLKRIQKNGEAEHKKRLRRIARDLFDLTGNLVETLERYNWPFDNSYKNLSEYFLSFVNEPILIKNLDIEKRMAVYHASWAALCKVNHYLNGQIVPLVNKAERENKIEPIKITKPVATKVK